MALPTSSVEGGLDFHALVPSNPLVGGCPPGQATGACLRGKVTQSRDGGVVLDLHRPSRDA